MAELNGWAGKILRVNLSNGETWTEDTTKYVPKFIGGLGVAWKIMWDEVGPNVKAFDPENRLIFAVGPATGTNAPTSSRTEIVGKSPHTFPREVVTRSGFGGDFGAYLKFAGYDAIVFEGKAKKPVYLSINDDKVEIKDASNVWGLDTFKAQDQMKREVGNGATVAIGPAGEKLVRMSSVICQDGHGSGQGGFGAVAGSKNLKGIIVQGSGKVKIGVSPKQYDELVHYTKTMMTLIGSVIPTHLNAPKSLWSARPGLTWNGGDEPVEIGEVDRHDLDRLSQRFMASDWFAGGKTAPYHVKNVGCYGCLQSPFSCEILLGFMLAPALDARKGRKEMSKLREGSIPVDERLCHTSEDHDASGPVERLLEAQEEERRRLAHELHDEMGQVLLSLRLGIERLADCTEGHPHNLAGLLLEMVSQAQAEVHRLAIELRPSALDDAGLVPALDHFLRECRWRSGLETSFVSVGIPCRRLDHKAETVIYRIVQEAVTNAIRHARARQVSVLLQRRGNRLVVIVEDDGQGFDFEAQLANPVEMRLGLTGMAERAAVVGATLTFETAPGAGTTVFLEVPLPSDSFFEEENEEAANYHS